MLRLVRTLDFSDSGSRFAPARVVHADWTNEDIRAVEQLLSHDLSRPWAAHEARPLLGGIQPARLLRGTGRLSIFAKKGSDPAAAERFEAEVDGLSRLADTGSVRTPQVLGIIRRNDAAILVLEAIHAVHPICAAWEQLGRFVAAQHRHTHARFGLERDNFIGLDIQDNRPISSWPLFYAERRLWPMLAGAIGSGNLPPADADRVERLIERVQTNPDLTGPTEPPALLHGDLWTANVLFAPHGPVVIDPAVYYGHREVEIAFTELFGPFDPAFYSAYEEAYPLDGGYQQRRALWQVYSLLIHVHHFGRSYLRPLREAVGQYV